MFIRTQAPPEWATEEKTRAARLRAEFARDFEARRIRWSGRNLSRMIRMTGERPGRIEDIRAILSPLGIGSDPSCPDQGEVFDHGEMWAAEDGRVILVGQPYDVRDESR